MVYYHLLLCLRRACLGLAEHWLELGHRLSGTTRNSVRWKSGSSPRVRFIRLRSPTFYPGGETVAQEGNSNASGSSQLRRDLTGSSGSPPAWGSRRHISNSPASEKANRQSIDKDVSRGEKFWIVRFLRRRRLALFSGAGDTKNPKIPIENIA